MPPSDDHLLVLAAGRGTRFGMPKALMPTGPAPTDLWWRTQQRAIDAAGLTATWVVNDTVRQAIEDEPDAPTDIVEADPAQPMWHSLITGLRHLAGRSHDAILIHPVDVPIAAPATFAALAASESDVTIPTHAGAGGHPVRITRAWADRHILTSADDPGARLDERIRPAARTVEVNDPAVTRNINTPEDLAEWLR